MDVSFVIPMIQDYPQIIMTVNALQAEMEYSNFTYEIIVVENGIIDSYTDNFKKAYRVPMSRNEIRYFFEPVQCGPAARMKGAEEARGKIIHFMDSHTIPARNSVNIMLYEMEDLDAGVLHGATVKTHVVPPHVRGLHYKLFGNPKQNLHRSFHGTYNKARQNTPYECMGGNLAYTMFKREELLELRGYHPKCRYYPHPEGYLPLKYLMFGRSVWAVPTAFHFHSVYRNPGSHGRPRWVIDIQDDKYTLQGGDFHICNSMICAYTLGGEKWLDILYDSWSKEVRSSYVLNGIKEYAKEQAEEEHEWVMNNMEKSLDEVLTEGRKKKIKGMEDWFTGIGEDPLD